MLLNSLVGHGWACSLLAIFLPSHSKLCLLTSQQPCLRAINSMKSSTASLDFSWKNFFPRDNENSEKLQSKVDIDLWAFSGMKINHCRTNSAGHTGKCQFKTFWLLFRAHIVTHTRRKYFIISLAGREALICWTARSIRKAQKSLSSIIDTQRMLVMRIHFPK
jgi:hypothetical protein